jgi:hypothetical protein
MTGALKHMYGVLSMADGHSDIRHYTKSGLQCGKMWSMVRAPDLNILDCIWVSFDSLLGYPPETTSRTNVLAAGMDPVAIDYYASKNVLLPLGGASSRDHDPDSSGGLKAHLEGARDFINANGGIGGQTSNSGDENIEVISATAPGGSPDPGGGGSGDGGSGGGGGGCFVATAAYGSRMAEEVEVLKIFRDRYLRNNLLGRTFIHVYYAIGPKLADFVGVSPLRKQIARLLLLPLVKICKSFAERT